MSDEAELSPSDEEIPMEQDLTMCGPPLDSDSDTRSNSPLTRFKWCSKVGAYVLKLDFVVQLIIYVYGRVILPHVGLVCLLASYALFGAIVFQLIERPEEDKEIVDEILRRSYEAFATQFIAVSELCNNATAPKVHWNFGNALFFSLTVITTIGYGTWTPVTPHGRIICILFALFGIPLLLVTIADIGKFLSDLMNFVYRKYRQCLKSVRRTSRRLSVRARSSLSPTFGNAEKVLTNSTLMEDYEDEEEEYIKLPMVMVMFMLVVYTALGGLLFRYLESWNYLDAFYFCFITMTTVGFGDMVPTDQKYILITLGYIMFGLALTTMCIDLAGTEYIRKIHYIGQKMETAKAAVSNMQMRQQLLMRTPGYGLMRTAGGRLVAITRSQAAHLGDVDWSEFDFTDEKKNILYQPLSPNVQKHVERANINVMPDEITDKEVGYCVRNKSYSINTRRPQILVNPNKIHTTKRLIPHHRRNKRAERQERVVLVMPFLWKESHV